MDELTRLEHRWQRERKARHEAERLLEEKSLELFQMNNELVELAASLTHKEEWSRSILEAAAEGVITTDEGGAVQFLNRAAQSMFGYTPDEISGKCINTLLPEELLNCPFAKSDLEKTEPLLSLSHETQGRRKDGSVFPAELTTSIAHPGTERIVIAVVRDITERKQAEKRLEMTNRQIQLILETVVEGIFGVDCEGNFTFINSAASKMLGWSQQELIGQHSHELMHHTHNNGSRHLAEECPIYTTFREGKGNTILEDLFWCKDGTSLPVEYVSRPIWEEERIVGAVISFRDITERIEAERERQKMEIQLHNAQKLEAIGQLAAGIAHEINTPTQYASDNTRFLQDAYADIIKLVSLQERSIAALTSGDPLAAQLVAEAAAQAETIEIDYLKEEIPLAVEQTLGGLERVTKIVRAMKEFSHPGVEEKTFVDLNSAIQSTIDVSRNEWKYHAELETVFDPELPAVRCLPGEINQAILNIIVNAAHAIADRRKECPDEKGFIRIATRKRGDYAEISISDNGGGIPEEILPRIFDPFFTTKGVGKGTGQGLSITYSAVVDKHNGTIEVDSSVGEGTTFIIRLPIDGKTGQKNDAP
ncbi:PAS domain S-box protein [endosymbiont of Ridgeia piscesae]|jgi:PAS domain S-box-containing protein|uniref:histidine kinase n=1 Tax=endosymbiont of Ridgeia piscesae TaxID=54398 RepID=A0A0T5Z445_9GAMM|nr:PAS domain S-box protein [endosymbiont of Ridgeia piscesae]KRT56039.1 PAS domain S-box [endosymbiont of Ridgeia piscesae]KRT57334.1 PAS domain S-box-containing protein [endosymbiont of Ridgeia piscesae]